MTSPTYAELRRLLAEATTGPVVAHVEKYSAHLRAPSGRIAEVFAPNLPELEPNALLFAAMRNALPQLLDAVTAADVLVSTINECPNMTADDVYLIRKFAAKYMQARSGK